MKPGIGLPRTVCAEACHTGYTWATDLLLNFPWQPIQRQKHKNIQFSEHIIETHLLKRRTILEVYSCVDAFAVFVKTVL